MFLNTLRTASVPSDPLRIVKSTPIRREDEPVGIERGNRLRPVLRIIFVAAGVTLQIPPPHGPGIRSRELLQLRSITFHSVTKIVELIVIKMHLSREFGSNAVSLGHRPIFTPFALARARPSPVRARINSRSNSASSPNISRGMRWMQEEKGRCLTEAMRG
jgi:hypothetical protein